MFAVALYARVATPRCLGVDGVAAALGLRLDGSTTAALKGAACVAVLYLGTLAERLVLGAFTLPEINPQAWRNLVVGPLTEELCFRACVLPLLIEAGITRWRAVRTAPLVFGLAHVHHGRRRVVDDGVPLSHAVIETTVQFAYTSLFGAFASYSFCRTHRLSAPVAATSCATTWGCPSSRVCDLALCTTTAWRSPLYISRASFCSSRGPVGCSVRERFMGLSFAVCYRSTRLLCPPMSRHCPRGDGVSAAAKPRQRSMVDPERAGSPASTPGV